jgi:alpha-tubulin suppressor-like RCC1 family protein
MMRSSMKHMLARMDQGFALPTLLIASVIMLTVLLSAVTAVSSITGGINSQYYNQLAREAAESGLAHARNCLRASGYTPTWSNANPLHPDTNCSGTSQASYPDYVFETNNVRTTFTIEQPTQGAAGSLHVVSEGKVELVRTSDPNQVWRTYTTTVAEDSRYNDTPQIGGGAGWKASGHIGYFLGSNGTLYAWGDNSAEQIGDASLGTTVSSPVKVSLPSGVSRVKKAFNSGQGASILCILGGDNQAYCRGKPGGSENGLMPHTPGWYRFALPGSLEATDMSVSGFGPDSACVLASDQQVYCAGENFYGTLGYGNNALVAVPITSPVQFALTAAGASLKAAKVFVQDFQTCVIATDTRAYCAGLNSSGQLGRGNTTGNSSGIAATPARVMMPGDLSLSDIRMTYHGSANALFYQTLTDSQIFMSGNDLHGTAGDTLLNGSIYSTPHEITSGNFSKMISVGEEGGDDYHTMCIVARDVVPGSSGSWCMGSNNYGQLGNGVCGPVNAVWQGQHNLGGEVVQRGMTDGVNYQMNSVMVITTAGNVWAWGDNTYGKLGTGAPYQACNPTPTKVALPAGVKAVDIANGDEFTAYILGDNGKAYAMGRNNNGQLGNGTTTNSNVPVEIKIPRQEIVF